MAETETLVRSGIALEGIIDTTDAIKQKTLDMTIRIRKHIAGLEKQRKIEPDNADIVYQLKQYDHMLRAMLQQQDDIHACATQFHQCQAMLQETPPTTFPGNR